MKNNVLYAHLFTPVEVGGLVLKNRAVVPGLTTNFADANGFVTENLIHYLAERAKGGYGLITTENIGVHPTGRVMPKMVMAHNDDYLPGLKKLVDSLHALQGVVFAQLSHAGRQTRSIITGSPLVSASPIPCPLNKETPIELSVEQIEELIEAFANAALRMKKAGFDGIELHGAHGYLINQFLSPYSNKRTDQYGGNTENRMRFLVEMIQRIKQKVGRDYPILVRLSVDEFMPDGLTVEESRVIVKVLERQGVHGFNISAGVYGSFNKFITVSGTKRGSLMEYARQIKAITELPVIGVGRINHPSIAEDFLTQGYADLIAFGRASMADPHLIKKTLERKEFHIVPCIACNVCLGRTKEPESTCPTNPLLGHEKEWEIKKSPVQKKILVKGSGLPVLQFIHVARQRGHAIDFLPDFPYIGGYFELRSRVPGQEEYSQAARYFADLLNQSNIRLLDKPEDESLYDDVMNFDLPYQNDKSQFAGFSGEVLYAREALLLEHLKGESVIVIGANLLGSETAVYLASKGAKVSLVDTNRLISYESHPAFRALSTMKLKEYQVDLYLPSEHIDCLSDRVSFNHEQTQVDIHPTKIVLAGELLNPAHDLDGPYGQTIRDFYEPGKLTKEVYRAVGIARAI